MWVDVSCQAGFGVEDSAPRQIQAPWCFFFVLNNVFTVLKKGSTRYGLAGACLLTCGREVDGEGRSRKDIKNMTLQKEFCGVVSTLLCTRLCPRFNEPHCQTLACHVYYLFRILNFLVVLKSYKGPKNLYTISKLIILQASDLPPSPQFFTDIHF